MKNSEEINEFLKKEQDDRLKSHSMSISKKSNVDSKRASQIIPRLSDSKIM